METSKTLFRFEPYINKYLIMCEGQIYAISKKNWPKVIEEFNNYKLITYEKFPLSSYSFPLKVQIQATSSCNLACRTCAVFEPKRKKDLSTQDLKLVIEKIANCGALNLEWSGGEPFLRKDLFQLVDYAHKIGLQQNILTNGMFFSEENIKFIKEMFYSVQVSIDGIEDDYEKIVGKKAWNVFVNSLKIAIKNDINLQAAIILQKDNVKNIEKIIEFCANYGIKKIFIAMEIPLGRSDNKNWDEYLKVIEDFEKKWPQIKLYATSKNIILNCFLEKTICKSKKNIISLISPGGFSFLYIDSCGDIYPFPFLTQSEFYLGSVLDADLKDLWLNSKILDNIRNINNKKIGCNCGMECSFVDRYLVYAYRQDIAGKAMPHNSCVFLK
ncbi:MAG: radical SAM protein [Patescibacteria group bacterium]|nr:radical SAM protein [Patescibacteria group bacterium]